MHLLRTKYIMQIKINELIVYKIISYLKIGDINKMEIKTFHELKTNV